LDLCVPVLQVRVLVLVLVLVLVMKVLPKWLRLLPL
jgi:hypothetical protein